jgi:hypothetical protein
MTTTITPSRTDTIEFVLSSLLREEPRAHRILFTRRKIAKHAAEQLGIVEPLWWWSIGLQEYRNKRERRFDVSAENYGRASQWVLFGNTGSPTARRLGQSLEHHLYTVQDAIRREASDMDREVLPALTTNEDDEGDIRYRINEFEVSAVHRLIAAGMERPAAIGWVESFTDDLRERWEAAA